MPESTIAVRPALYDAVTAQQAWELAIIASLEHDIDSPEYNRAFSTAAAHLPRLISRVLTQDAKLTERELRDTLAAFSRDDDRFFDGELSDVHERLLARIADLVDGIESGRYFGMDPQGIADMLVSMVVDPPDYADTVTPAWQPQFKVGDKVADIDGEPAEVIEVPSYPDDDYRVRGLVGNENQVDEGFYQAEHFLSRWENEGGATA
jgi:hypothetical protein